FRALHGADTCRFFFSSRRRHTRFSRDWSSDVCSSDLDIMHFHLEGHCRHSAMRTGLGNQVIALRGPPVGVFRVASLRLATYQTAGLIAKCDILGAEAIDPYP